MPQLDPTPGATPEIAASHRFLLSWMLLCAMLAWLIDWERPTRVSDTLLSGTLFLGAALIARFSSRVLGPWPSAGVFLLVSTFLYAARSHGGVLPGVIGILSVLVALVVALGVGQRLLLFVVTRLRLWWLVAGLFWGLLAWRWGSFYEADLQHAKFRVILWVIPVLSLGFVLFRLIGERCGEYISWGFLSASLLCFAVINDYLQPTRYLWLAGDNKPLELVPFAVAGVAALLVFGCALLTKSAQPRPLSWWVSSLHYGALLSIATLVLLMAWRGDGAWCGGLSRHYTDTRLLTSFLVFLWGPPLLERSL